MKSPAFIVEWHDKEAAGFTDVLPMSWFAKEGSFANVTHDVRGPKGGGTKAKCDLRVNGSHADLDYTAHAQFNAARDVMLGLMRIVFKDATRQAIARIDWKDDDAHEFATLAPPPTAVIEGGAPAIDNGAGIAKGIPKGITREHVLQAFKDFDAGVAHRFGPSTHYDVLDDTGRRYPPKAILGFAAKRLNGIELGPDDFSGGEKSKCFRVLRSLGFKVLPKPGGPLFPHEVDDDEPHVEGSVCTVTVNRYERDPAAREECIEHYGAKCQVCGFDFGETFGEIGDGFIHVHHLVPLGTIQKDYVVDPIYDLRPVCPNCHAMLHRRTPPFTIEELKQQRRWLRHQEVAGSGGCGSALCAQSPPSDRVEP